MINNNLKRTFCKKCNFKFDPRFETCPKCDEKNDEFVRNRCRNPLFFIDFIKCFFIVLIWVIATYVIPLLVFIVFLAVNPDIFLINEFSFSLQLSIYLFAIAGFVAILWNYKRYFFKDFINLRNVIIGVISGLIIVGLSQFIGYLVHEVGKIPVNSNQTFVESSVRLVPALAFFTVVIFGPIYEEVIFRVGFMGIGMKFNQKYGKIFAYALSIIIFVLIHLDFTCTGDELIAELAAIPTYLIGASVLCLAYDQGGFTSSVIAHIINNMFGFIFVMVI